uniref:5'-3' exonuclease n=1 Tax=Vescimonas sp. TaxID=2892404 RepID=UPI003F7E6635
MKLMVLDGNSLVNRAFYGVGKNQLLTTRQGLHTNAIYGFVTMLQKLLDDEKPNAVCVTFDRREPTFRHKADAAYKATRKGMPDELAEQMLPLKQVLAAMSIPCYELAGYEADDLLGTISRRCEAEGWDCVIATGDRDSLQLITDRTRVLLLPGGRNDGARNMTQKTFRAEYGFDPIHMIDLKALAGDSSDNISGVPGIGEKTAMTLVQTYGGIDDIYAELDSLPVKPAVLRRLKEGETAARHSHWLATIVTDAPLDFVPEANLRQPFRPELYELFLRLEFQKLIDKYHLAPEREPEELPDHTAVAEILETPEQAEEYLTLWRGAEYVTVYGTPDLRALAVECAA